MWVCLRYKNGVLLGMSSQLLDEWATVDPVTCGKKKRIFLDRFVHFEWDWMDPQIWKLVEDSLEVLEDNKHRQVKNKIAQAHKARKGICIDAKEEKEEKKAGENDLFHALTATETWKRTLKMLCAYLPES
ncbi:hypothetical protein BDR06DRAFT_974147 [Suillus hirtellus]|nr:hypothetical protein BDR06DRAFT_974147 [Suillus hirtellus]